MSKEHLPLGRVTGNPLEDPKQIFPEIFHGQVGLFEGEVATMFLGRILSLVSGMVSSPPRWMPRGVLDRTT